MFPRMKSSLSLLFCSALCSSCSVFGGLTGEIKVPLPPPAEIQIAQWPLDLAALTCADDPEPPAAPASDLDLGFYLLDLWAAGEDCRRKLDDEREKQLGRLGKE